MFFINQPKCLFKPIIVIVLIIFTFTSSFAETITVSTKGELENAINRKADTIIVNGELSEHVVQAHNINQYSKWVIIAAVATLGAGIILTPLTAGTSMPAAIFSVAATTGVSSGVLFAIVVLGGAAICWAISNDYDITIEIIGQKVKLEKRK